jgi:hypothetical protein
VTGEVEGDGGDGCAVSLPRILLFWCAIEISLFFSPSFSLDRRSKHSVIYFELLNSSKCIIFTCKFHTILSL